MRVVLLDANVIWSAVVRDLLLRCAERSLFRPIWSQEILDEFSRTIQEHRPDLTPKQIERLIKHLTVAFPDASIDNYGHLIPFLINAPTDRHVLAAAIEGQAETILTWNIKDFPPESCAGMNIKVEEPDQFLCELLSHYPATLNEIIRAQIADLKNPPITIERFLEHLDTQVPRFANQMRLSIAIDRDSPT